MIGDIPVFTLALVALIYFSTNKAFENPLLKEKYLFDSSAIILSKNYYRMISCAFLHADWKHFTWNMVGLIMWGYGLEFAYSAWIIVIFLVSALCGSLLTLWLRKNESYVALGASGGVMGVIFASLFLSRSNIGALFIPGFYIPGFVFAFAYLITSYLAFSRKSDDIGHEAHVGGALGGFFLAFAFNPNIHQENPTFFYSILMALIIIGFLFYLNTNHITITQFFKFEKKSYSVRYQDYDLAIQKKEIKTELDSLLDKIAQSGMDSLTKKEKSRLDYLSKKLK